MSENSEKINLVVSEKRIKLHLFKPSKREIWTVVGKGREHWLDPYEEYCSCPGYYFGKLNGKNTCYHIESVKLAQKENKFEIITFSDYEYSDFVTSIISGL